MNTYNFIVSQNHFGPTMNIPWMDFFQEVQIGKTAF